MVRLVPLGILTLLVGLLVLVAWVFGWWLPMLFLGIPVAVLFAEFVWFNWWGFRWWRERFANRSAKPS